ncbi:MAG: restriction endonuclease subunit S [Saprospiraceae bacterium]
MSSIMREDWIECELGEICFTTSGGTPSRNNIEFYQGSIPWVKSGELDKGIIYDTEEHISEEAIKNSSAKIFPEGTLLIALYGATIGKLAFLGVEAATNQAICGIFKSSAIEPKYLFNFLLNKRQKLISQGTGGAQPNISQTILKNLSIPFAPLPIQRAIVSKIEALFSDLDNGIANFKKAQEQLKVYRQAVLKKAFEGGFTSITNEENQDNHSNQKNHSSDNLPKGWKWVKISDVCDMKAGYFIKADEINAAFENGLFPCYGGNGLRGYVKSLTHEGLFPIVGRQGALCGNVHLVNGKFHATEHAVVVSAKKEIDIKCLYYKLTEMKLNQYSTGTAQPGLSVNKILPIKTIFPSSIQEQTQIVQEIESRLSVCDKMEQSLTESIEKAEALRQSILKKAFEGKLLSEAEIAQCKAAADYEPASELLKKIQAEKLVKEQEKKKKQTVNLPAGKTGKKSKK